MRYRSPMMLTLALVQHPPVFLNLVASTNRAVSLIAEAARGGANLVIFPESWLPGYPVWLDSAPGSALWDHPPAVALHAHLFEHSATIDGPEIATLAEAAVEQGVDVAMGMHERAGQTLYNTTVMLGSDGTRHARRKLMPTFNEKLIWGQGDGSTLGIWPRRYGRVGSLICWEHWMPLARAAMHAQDETLHVAQWPAVTERHQLVSRTYAFEGQCIVAACGVVLSRDDVLDGFDNAGGDRDARSLLEGIPADGQLLKNGGSSVIGPDADYILAPVWGNATTVFTEIDTEHIASARVAIDTAGHYGRPDVFELRVDTRPKHGVTFAPQPLHRPRI